MSILTCIMQRRILIEIFCVLIGSFGNKGPHYGHVTTDGRKVQRGSIDRRCRVNFDIWLGKQELKDVELSLICREV